MIDKRFKYSLNSKVAVVVFLLILLMVNYISARNFFRADITEDKAFAVSKATKDIVKGLDDLITIKVFFSKKLPPNAQPLAREVRDMLSEYDAYSSNLRVEYIDPAESEETEQEVQMLGIPPVEMNFVEKDQMQVQRGYLGIGVFFADRKEILPVVQDVSNLEYELTSAIKKVSSGEVKKVGFLTGHGEHSIEQGYGQQEGGDYLNVRQALEKNYEVETVDISSGEPITGIDTLIVAGPKTALSDRDKFEIDQFIMNGGQAIFLIDTLEIDQTMQVTPIDSGMSEMLASYGIRPRTDLVQDPASNEMVRFTKGMVSFFSSYPLWPKIVKGGFSSNPIVSKLEAMTMPWSSSVEEVAHSDIDVEVLAKTTPYATRQKDNFVIDPSQQPAGADKGQIAMAALAKGKFKSFFSGKQVPALSEDDPKTEGREVKEQDDEEGQIIVIADSDLIADGQLNRSEENIVFFMNAVDYLTLGSDLIGIRSKQTTDRPLKEISEAGKDFVKGINIIGIPLIVILFGIGRAWIRRRDKKMSME